MAKLRLQPCCLHTDFLVHGALETQFQIVSETVRLCAPFQPLFHLWFLEMLCLEFISIWLFLSFGLSASRSNS